MAFLYDNVSLNTTPFYLTKFKHEEVAHRDLMMYPLARERGSIVVDAPFKSKSIVLQGKIVGTSQSDLEVNVDTLKELLSREGKSLQLDYASGARVYKSCYVTRLYVDRDFYHLNYAPYEAEILAPYGIADDSAETTTTQSGVTTASKTGTETVGGSAYPLPTIKLTFSASTGVTTVSFLLNGDKVTYSGTIAASDILIFDTENKKVTLNGVEKDYTGLFPSFVVGANNWQIDTNGSARTYAVEIKYRKKYL